jgi:hypothetical protein
MRRLATVRRSRSRLMRRPILNNTKIGDAVYDPFPRFGDHAHCCAAHGPHLLTASKSIRRMPT